MSNKNKPRCKLCNRIKLDFYSPKSIELHDKEMLYFVAINRGVTKKQIIAHMHKWAYNHKEYCMMFEKNFECERPILPNRNLKTGIIEDCDPNLINYHELNQAVLDLEKKGIINIDYKEEVFKVINVEKLNQRLKELGLRLP